VRVEIEYERKEDMLPAVQMQLDLSRKGYAVRVSCSKEMLKGEFNNG
jgi:hypothetical protein